MLSRTKTLLALVVTAALLAACTSATAPATHGDCGGGVSTGTGPCP
jgi:hypothetical protein